MADLDNLPTTYPHPVPLAIIGGTGISSLTHSGFTPVAVLNPTTPWGSPSSPITILHTPHTTHPIAFLARHGLYHQFLPTEVPSQANIAALRSIGVRSVIAFSAVGSLREEIKPRDFIVPNQVVDRTKGVRPWTYFGNGVVGHVGFADPFDQNLSKIVVDVGHRVLDGIGGRLHVGGTLICMGMFFLFLSILPTLSIYIYYRKKLTQLTEGPQFSTRAESNLYRTAIPDSVVINMSCLPESKLAREAELAYTMICMSTDYDCWKLDEEPVTVETVMGNMKANAETANSLVAEILKELVKDEYAELLKAGHLKGQSKWSCCTKEGWKAGEDQRGKLAWLLGWEGETVWN